MNAIPNASESKGLYDALMPERPRPVRIWLMACILMVAMMVVVGGLTRLTDSGLSMVDWHPVHGVLPPLNEVEWQEELQNYRSSPQYQLVNKGMSVEEFKQIFWLEYIHRLLGRLVGLLFFIPLAWFLAKKMLPRPLTLRMCAIFLLGGAQGLLGWYMVKSGLADVPWVSPIRLAMHLGLAFILFGLLCWYYLILRYPAGADSRHHTLSHTTGIVLLLVYLQTLLGALVAGMDAGLLYDSFPKMNGAWIPPEVAAFEPWYRNLFENPATVHFLHRLGALVVTGAFAVLGYQLFRHKTGNRVKQLFLFTLVILLLQITLGALTVIHQVPILLASLHQLVALFLFAGLLTLLYSLRYRREGAKIPEPSSPLRTEREKVTLPGT